MNMLIWGGGPYHPTKAQSGWFKEVFEPKGFTVGYREDRQAFGPETLAAVDLLVISGFDDAEVTPVAEEQYWETPSMRRTTYTPLEDSYVESLLAYAKAGKPLLVFHGGILAFPDEARWTPLFDGRWVLGKTHHPPYGRFRVACTLSSLGAGSAPEHPILAGMPGSFEIEDECYCDLLGPQHSQVLLQAEMEGKVQTLAWAGNFGSARVAYCGLGHDMNTMKSAVLRRFVENCVGWLMG
jgi:type 1 glutamine amidotransferase